MSVTEVNGTRLYHEWHGAPELPPLVLVHGSWGDHRNWEQVVPLLAGTFQVLVYDRRGHSQSERRQEQGSVDEDAADLAALIAALGLGPAHIVGSSFGASIVLRLAASRPQLFLSMAVHEPPLFDLLRSKGAAKALLASVRHRIDAVIHLLETGDDQAAARTFVETVAFGPGAWAALPQQVQNTFVLNACTWLDEVRDPAALDIDIQALSGFHAPALLSAGDASPPLFALVLEQLAAALPQAERHTFTGAGHVPHLSHPAAYARRLAAFVAAAGSGAN